MGNRREYPFSFTPRGLSDAWDSTLTFAGACLQLQNLVFDQSNPEQIVARPGVGMPITSFAGIPTPGVISVQIAIGQYIFGMVASGLTAGYDQPFCYLIGTGFISISGITSSNVPATPSATGDIVQPTMAVIGPNIIVTHPGFNGSGNGYFGVINIANLAAPTWVSQNTATYGLPAVPNSVSNFNNRAYYSVGNQLWFSDVLVPGTMTNGGQSLTLGDTTDIIGQGGLPISTTSAGVVAALIVFKQFQIWQITGDEAITGSLAQNYLSLNVGCNSPRSIVQTPIGMIFAGIDGPYYVSSLGAVLPLTKDLSKLVQDVQKPFQNIVNPTRAAAAYSGSIYRICMDTIINGVSTTADYWFDVTIRRWSGPHTWPYDCASQVGNYFIVCHRNYPGMLFQSAYLPSTGSVFNDNGAQLALVFQSALFPKTQAVSMKEIIESTIELASAEANIVYQVSMLDEKFNKLVSYQATIYQAVSAWGGFTWGDGTDYGSENIVPQTYTIPWPQPIIFKKTSLMISVSASEYVSIGTFQAKYRDLGYLNFANYQPTIGLQFINDQGQDINFITNSGQAIEFQPEND